MTDYYENPTPRWNEHLTDDELSELMEAIYKFSKASFTLSLATEKAALASERRGTYESFEQSPVCKSSLREVEHNRDLFLPIAAEIILRAVHRGEQPSDYWDEWVEKRVFFGFDTKDVLDLAAAWGGFK